MMEAQFREVYTNLRKQVQELATGLIDHARTSYELVRDSLKGTMQQYVVVGEQLVFIQYHSGLSF